MGITDQAKSYYDQSESDAQVSLAIASWTEIGEDLPDGVSEACRFAGIRAAQKGIVDSNLWMARAMTAAAIQGVHQTIAGLLLPHAFRAMGMAKRGAAAEVAPGYEQARLILEEIKRLVPEGSGAWNSLFARLYHEKRGLTYLLEALESDAPHRHDALQQAEREYQKALERTKDPRGQLKVKGGLALVAYLRAKSGDEETQKALKETRRIKAAALEGGFADVADWAQENIAVMERGACDGWIPYEVL